MSTTTASARAPLPANYEAARAALATCDDTGRTLYAPARGAQYWAGTRMAADP